MVERAVERFVLREREPPEYLAVGRDEDLGGGLERELGARREDLLAPTADHPESAARRVNSVQGDPADVELSREGAEGVLDPAVPGVGLQLGTDNVV
jgi:hypothetical protein